MAYTRHGHHIPGTSEENPPGARARCGAFIGCDSCKGEILGHQIPTKISFDLSDNEKKVLGIPVEDKRQKIDRGFDLKKEEIALTLVKGYILNRLEKTDQIPHFTLYIVLSSYVLGSWKMLVSTSLPDGMYYEVTYNNVADETYIDAYKKFENVCLTGGETAAILEGLI